MTFRVFKTQSTTFRYNRVIAFDINTNRTSAKQTLSPYDTSARVRSVFRSESENAVFGGAVVQISLTIVSNPRGQNEINTFTTVSSGVSSAGPPVETRDKSHIKYTQHVRKAPEPNVCRSIETALSARVRVHNFSTFGGRSCLGVIFDRVRCVGATSHDELAPRDEEAQYDFVYDFKIENIFSKKPII